ncbi:MAG: hypothetical protein Q9219_005013 [cf. Caloplaca sp. 3 TL-2023]
MIASVGENPLPSTSNGLNNKQLTKGENQPVSRYTGLSAKVSASREVVLKAFNLSLITHLFQVLRHPTGRGLHEQTKIAICHDRLIAFTRALIHLLPFGFALFEIILNWNVYYVGATAYTTPVYQVIAKAHEILIQASIAAIVLSAIRMELLGEGLPFGLLFPGLQISQISYLCDKWTGECSPSHTPFTTMAWGPDAYLGKRHERPNMAITVGASNQTCILKLMSVRVDGTIVPDECSTVGVEASNLCPASEWYALRDWLSALRHTPPEPYIDKYGVCGSPLSICQVHGRNSARNLKWSSGVSGATYVDYATTQQAVIADALTDTSALWFASLANVTAGVGHGSPLSDQTDAAHTISSNYSQPYSTAVCLQLGHHNISRSNHVTFPLLVGVNPSSKASFNNTGSTPAGPKLFQWIVHPNLTYSQLMDMPAGADGYKLHWVALPEGNFMGSSIGAVVSLPGPASQTDFVACNLVARWGPASIVAQIIAGGIGPTGSALHVQQRQRKPELPISQSQVPSAETNDPQNAAPFGSDFLKSLDTMPSINISESWAQYLNPHVEPFNSSLLNVLMQYNAGTTPWNTPEIIQKILVMLLANGLARTAWGSTLQGDLKTVTSRGQEQLDGNYWLSGKGDVFEVDPRMSQEWVTLRVDSTLKGYAYNTLTTPPRLAIALLTVYCLLVLGYMVYIGISGISSNSWDSIAEVTALAINSTPTARLRNTCAGISELHIFKLPVRILVSKDKEGEGEHLELVLGQVDEDTVKEKTVVPNRTYGTLPKGVEDE